MGIDSIPEAVVDEAIQELLAVGVRGILNWEGLPGYQLFTRIRGPTTRGTAGALRNKKLGRQWRKLTEAARAAWRDLAASGVRPTKEQLDSPSLYERITK
jgi:hypothetical protein